MTLEKLQASCRSHDWYIGLKFLPIKSTILYSHNPIIISRLNHAFYVSFQLSTPISHDYSKAGIFVGSLQVYDDAN